MTTRTSIRTRKAPVRFEDESFAPGSNNKHTVGRVVDAGHSSEVEHDAVLVGDFQEVDREFVVEEEESDSEESHSEKSDGEEEEGEWESEEEEEEEEEWELEEEEEELGYWESVEHPLPEHTYIYNLQDGIWSYSSYVKKIDGEYIVTLGDWLDDCPENIHNEQEWNGNKVGKLKNVVLPDNRQQEYIEGEFVFENGWRNIQLPFGFIENEDDE